MKKIIKIYESLAFGFEKLPTSMALCLLIFLAVFYVVSVVMTIAFLFGEKVPIIFIWITLSPLIISFVFWILFSIERYKNQ